MTKSKKKKVSNKKPRTWADAKLADAIGKTTVIHLVWKDWRKELPESGDRVYLIIKAKNGLVPVTGYFIDETLPARGPFKESRWQTFHLDDGGGMIIIGGEGEECLMAWARPRAVGDLLNEGCTICKNTPCVC